MELQVALAVTCHTSIMVKYGKGSRMEHMKLHRTKCSRLIEDVIVPAMYKDLCDDMASQVFDHCR